MDRTLTWGCWNRTTDNNADCVLGHLQYLSGKETEGYIKGLFYVTHVVKIRIYVKYAH